MSFVSNLPQTIYCERGLSQSLTAEPYNTVANLAYFFVGYLTYKLLKKKKITDKRFLVLPWLLIIVGVGSFIYHTERNSVTLLFDAIPIYAFIVYLLFLTLRMFQQNQAKSIAILLGFILIEIGASLYIPQGFFNGSIRHLFAIFFISVIGLIAVKKFGSSIILPLSKILCLYALAIFLRSIDMTICQHFPLGTHFLWHILTAFAGYEAVLLLTLMKSLKDKTPNTK